MRKGPKRICRRRRLLLYRQKDKLLRLIVPKVQKSVCLKIYVAKLAISQRLVFKHKLIHISQVALECYSGHKCSRHWNCTICKDTMIIPYQDALQMRSLRAMWQWKTEQTRHLMPHFKYQWKTQNFNCAKIKVSIATSIQEYRHQPRAWSQHFGMSLKSHRYFYELSLDPNFLDVRST